MIFKKLKGKIINKNLGKSQRYTAFTLAEVLITLAIIGVVATLTIPILINNYQKNQYVTQLKKAYSEFNQALIQLANDNGCPGDLKCTGFFENQTNQTGILGDELIKYFKIAQISKPSDYTGEFSGHYPWEFSNKYDTSSVGAGSYMYNFYHDYNFITTDGIGFTIISSGYSDCSNVGSNNMAQLCKEKLIIDVNGPKLPNVGGRDIFYFFVTNGKGPLLYPYGGADSPLPQWRWRDASNNPQGCFSGNTDSTTCAGRIIDEGWQMNY